MAGPLGALLDVGSGQPHALGTQNCQVFEAKPAHGPIQLQFEPLLILGRERACHRGRRGRQRRTFGDVAGEALHVMEQRPHLTALGVCLVRQLGPFLLREGAAGPLVEHEVQEGDSQRQQHQQPDEDANGVVPGGTGARSRGLADPPGV